jgi:UDP-N-acetylmuramate--alanine ligase
LKNASTIENLLSPDVKKKSVYMVGIKGVGMTALAEILSARGIFVSGSDTGEKFLTDAILKNLKIPFTEDFSAEYIHEEIDLVIHSAAYAPETHPELLAAREKHIPLMSYPQALGEVSRLCDSAGVSGVHGKTTTTAMAGTICKALGLPVSVLVGSQVSDFGNRSTYIGGEKYFIAETCEYKRHFLFFSPTRLVITSVEEDHQDYFKNIEDIYEAFSSYALLLGKGGTLIHCADDAGAREVVRRVCGKRNDLTLIPYGFEAHGSYRITGMRIGEGKSFFALSGFDREWSIPVPGRHSVLNAAAALALAFSINEKEKGKTDQADEQRAATALDRFQGTCRRSQIIGSAAGIFFMDDYAHHPTAIAATLQGIREFHPERKIIVDFMSHTFSRTKALLGEFAASFSAVDEVVLHKIYASARETTDITISGESLYDETRKHHQSVRYYNEVMDAFSYLTEHLVAGDLFITMGAGDNWKLSHRLYQHFKAKAAAH